MREEGRERESERNGGGGGRREGQSNAPVTVLDGFYNTFDGKAANASLLLKGIKISCPSEREGTEY